MKHTNSNFRLTWDDFFAAALLAVILGFSAAVARGQSCTVRTQGWASSSGSLGRGSVDVRWISTTPAFQVREYRVYAPWALNQTPQGYFNAGTALHYSLQYVCPINGGPVTIEEIRTNGTSCSVAYGGPGGLPHGGCSGGNTSGLATRNAASFGSFLAPGGIGAAFGDSDFTTTTAFGSDTDPTTPGIQLPKELGGVRLFIGSEAAGLFFTSPKQVNFHVPAHFAPGQYQVQATTPDGRVLYGDIVLIAHNPGIFTTSANGDGQAVALWWVFRNGIPFRIVTPEQLRTVGIQPGDRVFLILYGTGIGAGVTAKARIAIGTGNVLELDSLYAGNDPYFVGLDQLNFEVPVGRIWTGLAGCSVTVHDGTGAFWTSNGVSVRGL